MRGRASFGLVAKTCECRRRPCGGKWRRNGPMMRLAVGGNVGSPSDEHASVSSPRHSISEKPQVVLFFQQCSSRCRLGGGAAAQAFDGGPEQEIWRKAKIALSLLQAFDFPRNGRRNLWKYLEKKAANLEMFGLGAPRLAGSAERRTRRRPPYPSSGNSSTRNSRAARSPLAASAPSRWRNSTRRIFPEIVFGSSANSIRRTRL